MQMTRLLQSARRALCVSCRASTVAASSANQYLFIQSGESRHFHALATSSTLNRAVQTLRSSSFTQHDSLHTSAIAADSIADASQPQKSSSSPRKPSSKPKKPHLDWNVHHEVKVLKTPLPQVLARLQAEVTNHALSAPMRRVIDIFYFHCIEQLATLPSSFVKQVIEYYEETLVPRSLADKKTTLNEGLYPMIARLYVAQGDKLKAWQVVEKILATGKRKIHFRLVAPILEFECKQGNFADVWTRWRWLKTYEMEWTATMEDTLIDMVIACQRHHREAADSPDLLDQMKELLTDLGYATREISAQNASRLCDAFTAAGFTATYIHGEENVASACSSCHAPLQKMRPTQAEYARLVHALETTVSVKNKTMTASTKEFLVPFKRWLLTRHARAVRDGTLHYILDAPNIAYLNQNYDNGSFRFDHIDLVADLLTRAGHVVSITIPHSYLEESSSLHIRTTTAKTLRRKGHVIRRTRSREDKAIIDKWQQEGALFSCRTDALSDDVFWLYASALLGDAGRVVTNDQGRDHVFRLQNKKSAGMTTWDVCDPTRIPIDLLTRWRESAIVNVAIQHGSASDDALQSTQGALAATQRDIRAVDEARSAYRVEEVKLLHPPTFTRTPQVASTGVLHFPVVSEDPEQRVWLCLQ